MVARWCINQTASTSVSLKQKFNLHRSVLRGAKRIDVAPVGALRTFRLFALWVCIVLSIVGCTGSLESQVKLATDLDKEVAGPIVAAFYRAEQGVVQPEVRTIAPFDDLDSDPGDDVLLTSNLLALEQLSQQGKLQPIRWAPDRLISPQFASPIQTWQAFAAAAMVLVVHDKLDTEAKRSLDSMDDLTDTKWKQRCGIADPANSHATLLALASMAQSHSGGQSEIWLQQVADTAVILPGVQAVLTQVDRGELDWGLVPSDVAAERLDHTARFEMIFPDQQANQAGTVLIPYAVAVKASAQHPNAAARLANYLASPPTAERLAMGESALIPLSSLATVRPRILNDQAVRWAQVDYKSLDPACQQVRTIFSRVSKTPATE